MPIYEFSTYLRVSGAEESAARRAAAKLAVQVSAHPELSLSLEECSASVEEETSPSPAPAPGSSTEAGSAQMPPPSMRRYAMVVVIEASGPEDAWEAVSMRLGANRSEAMPEVVYLGAPWEGIDAEAEDLATEGIAVAMTVPGELASLRLREHALCPCDPAEAGPRPAA